MFFWNKFCGLVIFFLILIATAYGQTSPNQSYFEPNKILDTSFNYFVFYNPLSINPKINLNSEVPPDFATCKYGFFCKQEMKFEKVTNIPLRIRLGSLEQCNYYEGKTGWNK